MIVLAGLDGWAIEVTEPIIRFNQMLREFAASPKPFFLSIQKWVL